MEAAAVSAAVSGTLKLVCNKLAPLVTKEYSSIVGVKEDLRELQDLAQEITSRLEAAEDRSIGDAPFLKKLKEAVYEVDDVVDEFQLKAEKQEADGDGGFVSRYLCTKPKSLVFQCKAAKKIKKIKKTFDDIAKQIAVLNTVVGRDTRSYMNNTVVNKETLPIVDEAAVIGRDQETDDIISELLKDDDQQRIKVVSIVGLGGSGKTTLAQLVFKKLETMENNNFTAKLWVHVSQEKFQLEKILKKLFEAISDERSEGLPLMNIVNRISDRLANRRFLLVLDDVWVEDCNKWQQLMVYLKNGSSGSRILLTTRSRNVATTVESTAVIDLPLLSKDYSWQVFQQSFGNAVKDLDSEFQEVGKEIVNKCGGLPLPIKVLAGVLRDKKRVEQWRAIKDNNLLDVDDKERQVSACLRLSYFNLPSHLRQCFTICSIFPKGHLIDKDQLIAHDMIPESSVNYLEYIGDDYFNHLVQMYFIQDVKETWDGRVRCKMHDLVHDLARFILGDEISLAVPEKATNFTKTCRYFSMMEQTRHIPPKNTFQKARAMYIAKNDSFIFGKALKNAKHLRSFTVEDMHTSALTAILQTKNLRAVLQTKNLRYLNISELKHETLPEVISEIWSLQALHVTSSDLVKLPESIGKLQKLRVVNFSYSRSLTGLPDSIGNCAMISSIDLSSCLKVATLPSSISRNRRLRVLRLGHTIIEMLPSSITTLENLECLDLQYCSRLAELPAGIGNLKKLVVLNLKECEKLRAIPKGIAQLTRLETLGLFVMGEDNENYAQISDLENINKISGELTICGIAHGTDPDVEHKEWLKQKTNLQNLRLDCARDVGVNSENQLDGLEPPPGIKNLKIVHYSGQESTKWMFRFRLLSRLILSDFPKLERLEGLTELPCLETLVLEEMAALKSISGGPFPSLSVIYMYGMPNLGVVWMVTEGSLADVEEGQLQIGDHLSVLRIFDCPKLMVMPYFPWSLKRLRLARSNVQLLGLPGLGQGSSLPSSSAGLSSFSFSRLKELELC
jgi:Leucine-rich repeat (LRR) protein